ncbi:MAG: carboxypeptidase-like regulatory domain-containing protein, partial [Blastocatellia bacterium]
MKISISMMICSCVLGLGLSVSTVAQSPTGTIAGTVTDSTGAVVTKAKIIVSNRDTGLTRTIESGEDGAYSAPALPAGSYDVRVEATGFRGLVRTATVETGTTTTVNLGLQA